jgi:hypothetical protein
MEEITNPDSKMFQVLYDALSENPDEVNAVYELGFHYGSPSTINGTIKCINTDFYIQMSEIMWHLELVDPSDAVHFNINKLIMYVEFISYYHPDIYPSTIAHLRNRIYEKIYNLANVVDDSELSQLISLISTMNFNLDGLDISDKLNVNVKKSKGK